MPAFATTILTDARPADGATQPAAPAPGLPPTESGLGGAISSAGHSVAAAGSRMRKRMANGMARSRPGPPSAFSDDPDAQRLCELLDHVDEAVYVGSGTREEIDALTDQVCAAVSEGSIVLDYAPGRTDYVAIPATDEPLRIQALIYWRIRLATTIPKLLESRGRLGDGASIQATRRMFKRIDQDARASRTDYSDMPPAGA